MLGLLGSYANLRRYAVTEWCARRICGSIRNLYNMGMDRVTDWLSLSTRSLKRSLPSILGTPTSSAGHLGVEGKDILKTFRWHSIWISSRAPIRRARGGRDASIGLCSSAKCGARSTLGTSWFPWRSSFLPRPAHQPSISCPKCIQWSHTPYQEIARTTNNGTRC